ncbi:hypothetical protein LXL04_006953 [Taraxacum kok-saghyz]
MGLAQATATEGKYPGLEVSSWKTPHKRKSGEEGDRNKPNMYPMQHGTGNGTTLVRRIFVPHSDTWRFKITEFKVVNSQAPSKYPRMKRANSNIPHMCSIELAMIEDRRRRRLKKGVQGSRESL